MPRKQSLNKKLKRAPTIAELEKILNSESDVPLEILPNGEVFVGGRKKRTAKKPLTMRENLGGEYALRRDAR